MNPRTTRLRQESLDAVPTISAERALLLTEFYRDNLGRLSTPLLRARSFHHLCAKKTLFLGEGELIVGERGPVPKAVPTYPELTCHSLEDLHVLDSRPKTWYRVAPERPRGVRGDGDPVLARPLAARPALPASSRPNGTRPTTPASSPSSWSSGHPGTPCSTTRSTGRG